MATQTLSPTAYNAKAFQLTGLQSLMAQTQGHENLKIAIIDGPVNPSHSELSGARISFSKGSYPGACQFRDSSACAHGTFVAGILAGNRDGAAPGISPGCELLVHQIFCESGPGRPVCPEVRSEDLENAVRACVDAGARVINMSVGFASGALQKRPSLTDAFEYAFRKGVLLIAASGNQGRIGQTPLFDHPWILRVVACDNSGQPTLQSNLSLSMRSSGLLAPGFEVAGLAAGGGLMRMSGTSVAAPFVTGAAALLWTLAPHAKAWQIRQALLGPASGNRSVVPPVLNAEMSLSILNRLRG